jgi:hypothetical protein
MAGVVMAGVVSSLKTLRTGCLKTSRTPARRGIWVRSPLARTLAGCREPAFITAVTVEKRPVSEVARS